MKKGEPDEWLQAADVPTEAAELPTEAAVTTTEAASLTSLTTTTEEVVYFPGVTCPACDAAKLKVTPFHRYDALVRHWRERHLHVARVFPCPTQDCRYTSRRSHDTRVHLLNQHCGGERGEQFRKMMKQAKPANVKNINYVNSGPFFLPLSEPPPAAKSTKRPAEEAPSEAPPAKLVEHPRPAVELQTPTIPPIPKARKSSSNFCRKDTKSSTPGRAQSERLPAGSCSWRRRQGIRLTRPCASAHGNWKKSAGV